MVVIFPIVRTSTIPTYCKNEWLSSNLKIPFELVFARTDYFLNSLTIVRPLAESLESSRENAHLPSGGEI